MLFELKASLRQEPGWGGVEAAVECTIETRGNLKEFEFVFGKEQEALFTTCLTKRRKFSF